MRGWWAWDGLQQHVMGLLQGLEHKPPCCMYVAQRLKQLFVHTDKGVVAVCCAACRTPAAATACCGWAVLHPSPWASGTVCCRRTQGTAHSCGSSTEEPSQWLQHRGAMQTPAGGQHYNVVTTAAMTSEAV
jgi:hypothetical protein